LSLKVDRLRIQKCSSRRNDQQASAKYVGTLLIPQRQLSRELRILIDASLYLLRTIDESCLREVVDHRCPILCAVATAGNPPNQIISVCRCEGQDIYKLFASASRQFHQNEIRLHHLNRLLTVTIGA